MPPKILKAVRWHTVQPIQGCDIKGCSFKYTYRTVYWYVKTESKKNRCFRFLFSIEFSRLFKYVNLQILAHPDTQRNMKFSFGFLYLSNTCKLGWSAQLLFHFLQMRWLIVEKTLQKCILRNIIETSAMYRYFHKRDTIQCSTYLLHG